MDAEFQGRHQDEVLEGLPEKKLEQNEPCFDVTNRQIKIEIENDGDYCNSSLQNTSNLNLAIDTGACAIDQTVKVENVDFSLCSENTGSICKNVVKLRSNQDKRLLNVKQEMQVDEDRLQNLHPYMEENSNIYIFENKDSNFEDKDNVGQDTLVEIIKVKQEIKDTNLNIENCVSEAANMELKTYTIDSQTDSVDFSVDVNNMNDIQHNLLLNSSPCTLLNPVSQVQTIKQNKFCHPNNTVPCISQVKEHTFSDNASGKISVKLNKQPDKRSKDFNKDQPINSNGQPLTCVMCGKEVNTLNSLIEHICIISRNTMNNKMPYECSLCPRHYKTFANLKKHFELHRYIIKEQKPPDKRPNNFILLKTDQPINTNGQPFTCVMCCKEVNTLNSLIEHICIIPHNTMNNERPYECSLCQRDFKTFAHLKKHFELHYDIIKERKHLCYVCGNKFTTLSTLSKHILSHKKNRPYQCTVCDKAFKTLIHLQRHMITHSTERPHQCNVCEKDFKTLSVLRMHMISHRTERPHQCHVCEKEFKTLSLLKMHRRWHSTERPYKCNVCDKEFMISKDLTRHMISHSTERPHQCNVCDKGFKYQDTLRHHMISHNSVWPHTCSKCHKGFKTDIALQNHMVSHTEGPNQYNDGVDVNKQNQPSKPLGNHVIKSTPERPHQCKLCDKGFKNSYVLKRHMLSHSEERPHKCNVCDKEFKRLTTLRQHMICHSSECPHLCGVCVKRFKIAEDLERHMITHRTERPNQCSLCSKECKNLPALRYHRRTKHGTAKLVCEKTLTF